MSKTRIEVFIIQFSEIILPITQCLRKGLHVFSWVGSLPRSCGLRPPTIMPPPIKLFCRHRYYRPPIIFLSSARRLAIAAVTGGLFGFGISLRRNASAGSGLTNGAGEFGESATDDPLGSSWYFTPSISKFPTRPDLSASRKALIKSELGAAEVGDGRP